MIAIVCLWGSDLSVGPTGDIGVVSIQADVQQRIIRRLLTNPYDYVWHTDYGGGVGRYVGEPYSGSFIEGTILSQLQFEALVAVSPPPRVQTNQSLTGPLSTTSVTIQYQIAGTPTANSIALDLGT